QGSTGSIFAGSAYRSNVAAARARTPVDRFGRIDFENSTRAPPAVCCRELQRKQYGCDGRRALQTRGGCPALQNQAEEIAARANPVVPALERNQTRSTGSCGGRQDRADTSGIGLSRNEPHGRSASCDEIAERDPWREHEFEAVSAAQRTLCILLLS